MRRTWMLFLLFGMVGAVLSGIAASLDARRALLAWTSAYGFFFATVVSGLGLTMVLRLARSSWWLVLRPSFSLFAASTPLLVAFFLPIGVRPEAIFPWAAGRAGETWGPTFAEPTDPATVHGAFWNTPSVWLARSIGYLAIILVIAFLVHRSEASLARAPSAEGRRRARIVSGAALPVLAMAMTFASFDWLMSMERGWASTAYGLYVATSGLVSAIGVVVLATWLAQRGKSGSDALPTDHAHALGRLLLMAVILWAYIGFFQFLLIWIANLPREVTFFVARKSPAWMPVGLLLVFGRFVAPFLLLLSRPRKQSLGSLAWIALWLVATTAIDFAWLVLPSAGATLALVDLAPLVAIVGFAGAYATRAFDVADSSRESLPPAAAELGGRALRYRSP